MFKWLSKRNQSGLLVGLQFLAKKLALYTRSCTQTSMLDFLVQCRNVNLHVCSEPIVNVIANNQCWCFPMRTVGFNWMSNVVWTVAVCTTTWHILAETWTQSHIWLILLSNSVQNYMPWPNLSHKSAISFCIFHFTLYNLRDFLFKRSFSAAESEQKNNFYSLLTQREAIF